MKLYDSKGNEVIILERKDYVTYLGIVSNYESKDFTIPLNGVYLLSVVNTYCAGGLFFLETGDRNNHVRLTSIKHDSEYLDVSSKDNQTITVQAGNALYDLYLIKLFY